MLGVVKLLPVDNNVPSVESEYHLMVPVPVADSVTVPVAHLAALVPVGAEGTPIIVAVTDFLNADLQPVAAMESIA